MSAKAVPEGYRAAQAKTSTKLIIHRNHSPFLIKQPLTIVIS
jgi:hypothetical protein